MLEPTDRRLLFELLRPPAGYRLSCAVGTTYSLDLLALLVTPLAFTLFDWETKEGKLTASPTALLESLRRHADKLSLFCQAGTIQPPAKARQLFGYLEQSVVEVGSPRGGVFHAKLWVLRFEPVDHAIDEKLPVEYRVLCPSRNLTFDRAWDTMLAIEGTCWPREPRIPQNEPLAELVARLPELAVRQPISGKARQHAELIAQELPHVTFQLPEDIDSLRFWPIGLDDRYEWPFGEPADRMLVVSPFVSDGLLSRLAADVSTTIISRPEELSRLRTDTLELMTGRYTLDSAAEVDVGQTATTEASVDLADVDSPEPPSNDETEPAVSGIASDHLSGLHAKVYIADRDGSGHIWTGSANATNAAFARNLEILMELSGPQELCGVDAILNPRNSSGFRSLLQPFVRPEDCEVDEVGEELERLLDQTRNAIARHQLRIKVEMVDDRESELFDLTVQAAAPLPADWLSSSKVSCRPITLPDSWRQSVEGTPPVASFRQLHFERLTPFMLFRVQVAVGDRMRECQFVVNLPISGLPENRRERLLLALLRNSEQLMRYLLFLLADDGWDARDTLGMLEGISGGEGAAEGQSATTFELPLLEPMLAALTGSPDKLDRIGRLIEDLEKTPQGRAMIPDEFYAAWQPIWEVRKRRQS